MLAQQISARIVLTVVMFALAIAVALANPLPAGAADGPDEFPVCWAGSYVSYLDCVSVNLGISGERSVATADRLALIPNTVTDYVFMEMNAWGEDFVFATRTTLHDRIWDGESLLQDGILSR